MRRLRAPIRPSMPGAISTSCGLARSSDIESSSRVGNDLVIDFVGTATMRIGGHFLAPHTIEQATDGTTTMVIATGLIGGNASGIISGTDGAETLDGRGGDDFLFGNAGFDRLIGGDGDDLLVGGESSDFADRRSGPRHLPFLSRRRHRLHSRLRVRRRHDRALPRLLRPQLPTRPSPTSCRSAAQHRPMARTSSCPTGSSSSMPTGATPPDGRTCCSRLPSYRARLRRGISF